MIKNIHRRKIKACMLLHKDTEISSCFRGIHLLQAATAGVYILVQMGPVTSWKSDLHSQPPMLRTAVIPAGFPCSQAAAAFSHGAGRGQQLSAAGASSQIPPAQGVQPSSRPPFHSHPSSTILGVHCWGGWCSGFVCKAWNGRA